MKKTMILLAALAVSMSASALDLQDYVLGGARPKGIGAVTPAMDGKYYYQIVDGGKTIARYAYKTGRREATVLDSLPMQTAQVKRWDGYQMSQSESAILLWADSEPIYRHSFTARFFVYDCKNRQIKAVANDQPVQIATLSPDGERVAYVTGNNVYVQLLADGNITQVTTDGRKNHVINAVPDWVYEEEFAMLNSFAWSSDSRTLSFIRWDESQVPMYSMTMYEGDCKPNEDYALYPGSYDYKYPVAGEKNAVVSVHSYDVTTAKLSKMDVPLAQDDYVPHIGYAGPADALMVMKLNRTQNDMHIYRVNPATGAARDIYHETSASWIDSEMSRNVAYYDNFMVIPNETSGYCQLYQYDLDGKLMRQLTTGQEPVTAYYGYDSKNRMFYYQCTDGPLNRVVRRVDTKGRVQDVEVAKGTNSATFNSDFTYYIHAFSNVDTPTQYRLKQVGRKGSVRDLQLNDDYCAKYMVPEVPRREFVTFENDGYTLNGFIIKPVDFDPSKKYPVIMSQYSGPGSQQVRNNWKLDWEEYFATQGYIVACFDGRGTGARGKAFESLIYQNLGHYETIDQVAAAQYMASQPWVDATGEP